MNKYTIELRDNELEKYIKIYVERRDNVKNEYIVSLDTEFENELCRFKTSRHDDPLFIINKAYRAFFKYIDEYSWEKDSLWEPPWGMNEEEWEDEKKKCEPPRPVVNKKEVKHD